MSSPWSGGHEQCRGEPAEQADRPAVQAARRAGPIDQAAREIATRRGLEVVPGKLVWELRPHRAQLAAEGGTPGMLLFLHPRRARRIAGRAGYWSWLSSSWS